MTTARERCPETRDLFVCEFTPHIGEHIFGHKDYVHDPYPKVGPTKGDIQTQVSSLKEIHDAMRSAGDAHMRLDYISPSYDPDDPPWTVSVSLAGKEFSATGVGMADAIENLATAIRPLPPPSTRIATVFFVESPRPGVIPPTEIGVMVPEDADSIEAGNIVREVRTRLELTGWTILRFTQPEAESFCVCTPDLGIPHIDCLIHSTDGERAKFYKKSDAVPVLRRRLVCTDGVGEFQFRGGAFGTPDRPCDNCGMADRHHTSIAEAPPS